MEPLSLTSLRLGLRFSFFSRKTLGFQPVSIGVERSLGLAMLLHRARRVVCAFAVALSTLFGSKGCFLR